MAEPISQADKSRRLKLKLENGLSYSEIAAIEGVSPQAIHSSIKDLLPTEETKTFQEHRADILAEIQRKLITCIDDKLAKSLVERRGLVDFGILFDKERLERGQSTQNLATIHADIAALKEARSGGITGKHD
jgi:predicted DNA-binding protein YlxM (UPF0122 family)